MQISMAEISKSGVEVDKFLVYGVTEKYLKILNRCLFELYEKDLLPSPFLYDDEILLRVIYEEVKAIVDGLVTREGSISFSADSLKLALKATPQLSREEVNIINLIIQVLDAHSKLMSLSHIAKKVTNARREVIKFPIKYRMVGYIKTSSVIPITDEIFSEVLARKQGYKYFRFRLGEYIVRETCIRLNIPDDVVDDYKRDNKSLFLVNGSFDDDCDYILDILNNRIVSKGDYASLLVEKMEEYYESLSQFSNISANFADNIFAVAYSKMNEYAQSLRALGFETFFVNSTLVYFGIKEDNYNGEFDEFLVTFDDFSSEDLSHVGYICYDSHNDLILDVSNRLRGMCGEFIPASVAKKLGYTALCTPVSLTHRGRTGLYYPLGFLKTDKGYDVIEKLGVSSRVSFDSLDSFLSSVDADYIDELVERIKADEVSFSNKSLVADAIIKLLYVDCGEHNGSLNLCDFEHSSLSKEEFSAFTDSVNAELEYLSLYK